MMRRPVRRLSASDEALRLPEHIQQGSGSPPRGVRRFKSQNVKRRTNWRSALKPVIACCLAAAVLLSVYTVIRSVGSSFHFSFLAGNSKPYLLNDDLVVTFQHVKGSEMKHPKHLKGWTRTVAKHPDFGDLDIRILEDNPLARRQIYHNLQEDQIFTQLINAPSDDDSVEGYYAFDDDRERDPVSTYDDDEYKKKSKGKQCRRTAWHRDNPQNCNPFHEYDLQQRMLDGQIKFAGAGAYREVYVSKPTDDMTHVYKTFYWGAEFSNEDMEFMRMDAIVAERLTWSPLIVDIYGFCAVSMFNEAMVDGDIEDVAVPGKGRDVDGELGANGLEVRNRILPMKKLEFALDMAEAVALLHSFPDGVIVHDDIQLSQFLITEDNTLKLNDFNRAEIMLFNKKDQEYCRYRNNPGHGDWRAPEEYWDNPLNEKIDVWSLGNNFYSLLTGVYPFYTADGSKEVQKLVKKKKVSDIDERWKTHTLPEKRLAELIPRMWRYNADERIDVFEVVRFLRHAVEEVKRLGVNFPKDDKEKPAAVNKKA